MMHIIAGVMRHYCHVNCSVRVWATYNKFTAHGTFYRHPMGSPYLLENDRTNSETRFERDFWLLCTKKRETASLSD
jgi:proteasome lid subunit RPN8/RPN11